MLFVYYVLILAVITCIPYLLGRLMLRWDYPDDAGDHFASWAFGMMVSMLVTFVLVLTGMAAKYLSEVM